MADGSKAELDPLAKPSQPATTQSQPATKVDDMDQLQEQDDMVGGQYKKARTALEKEVEMARKAAAAAEQVDGSKAELDWLRKEIAMATQV